MAGDLVKLEGDRGEYRVTREMVELLPTGIDIEGWFAEVVNANRHLNVTRWFDPDRKATTIMWEPRTDTE